MFSKINKYIYLWKPWFWLPAISPAFAILYFLADDFSLLKFILLTVIIGFGICGFAEVINDRCNYMSGYNVKSKKVLGISLAGGSSVIRDNPQENLILSRNLLFISFSLSITISLAISIYCFLWVLIGLILAWLYSARPVRAKDKFALGVLFQALGYGPIVVNISLSAIGHACTLNVFWSSLVNGLWVASIGLTADILDFEEDKLESSQRLTVVLGKLGSLIFIITGATCAFSGLLLLRHTNNLLINHFVYITLICFVIYIVIIIFFYKRKLPYAVHFLSILLEILFPIALFWRP